MRKADWRSGHLCLACRAAAVASLACGPGSASGSPHAGTRGPRRSAEVRRSLGGIALGGSRSAFFSSRTP
eukprot:4627795-Alexandrium_andersonii.AAC.1